VLVIGSTGYLGSHLVSELKATGHWVRALTRRPDSFALATQQPDEIFVGQATEPDTLTGLCDEIDFVVSALGQTKRTAHSFWEVDYLANKNILELSIASGVRRFLTVSVVHPKIVEDLEIIAAREAMIRDLIMAPIGHTIVRSTGFYSDMREFLDMARTGRIWLIGPGTARMNPVHGADVARAAVRALLAGVSEVAVGGPEVLSYNEIAELAFRILGKPPKIIHIPCKLAAAALSLVRQIRPPMYATGSFLMRMMQNDTIAPRIGRRTLKDEFEELVASA
jgi:uncharacterized protein YbjT (DUF2867 family)